jgi:peptidoglycan/LPS O-acetylase OafA/YrhL
MGLPIAWIGTILGLVAFPLVTGPCVSKYAVEFVDDAVRGHTDVPGQSVAAFWWVVAAVVAVGGGTLIAFSRRRWARAVDAALAALSIACLAAFFVAYGPPEGYGVGMGTVLIGILLAAAAAVNVVRYRERSPGRSPNIRAGPAPIAAP